ncbi:hypothetical protein [Streptomyces canus]|uniref:hypothetical protein n=1 Tax=Streptomyces canus TaxID=58343 RepID=UPI002E3046EF|nr:hypothetical protein [Streptomyces canus]
MPTTPAPGRRTVGGPGAAPPPGAQHQRTRPIPSPAARDLTHHPRSLFFLLWGVDSGA